MGNRAVITTKENWDNDGVGVYLHWNGGRDSVEAFLKYCELKGYRKPTDDCYGWAYLCGVLTNYFGDGLSCGIDVLHNLDCDNGDNGMYIIDGWEIVDRVHFHGLEQDNHNLVDMIIGINNSMPINMQFTMDELEELNISMATPFTDDEEKMVDFVRLSKDEFLESYSYLTNEEYEATVKDVLAKVK